MSWLRWMRHVRFLTAAMLLAALVFGGAVAVSAAGTISATAQNLPIGTFSTTLTVNCGGATATCQVYVARNGAPIGAETLYTNVTGTASPAPAFIVDGCYNFRLYDGIAHTTLIAGVDIGHTDGTTNVCTGTASGNQPAGYAGGGFSTGQALFTATPATDPNATAATTTTWDSGYTANLEDAQVWIQQNTATNPFAACGGATTPSASEVLYSQNPSSTVSDLVLIGGGPYCFSLYQGTGHALKSAPSVTVTTTPYLTYTADASQLIRFNTADSAKGGLVCVYGSITGTLGIPGGAGTQIPFTFNSFGYGNAAATFQIAGVTNTYVVYKGATISSPVSLPLDCPGSALYTGAANPPILTLTVS
jgi:hypothetical protein